MWSVLFGDTVPWAAAIATLLLVLAATLLIIHQVRASDGDMSVRLRWLGLHVQRSAPSRTPPNPACRVQLPLRRPVTCGRCGQVNEGCREQGPAGLRVRGLRRWRGW